MKPQIERAAADRKFHFIAFTATRGSINARRHPEDVVEVSRASALVFLGVNYIGAARDIIEFALAHKLPDKVEASYRRSTALEKRKELMDAWAGYCAS